MFGPFFKLLGVLNSETEPDQISLAFALSMVAGLTPFFGLQNLLVLFLVLFLRVNISAFMLGTALFSAIAYALDPLFHLIGLKALTIAGLKPLWTSLYNIAFFRLLKFNNSILMGSLIVSLFLFVPLFILSNYLIRKYREHLLAWVNRSRIMKAYKASNFYKMYQTYNRVRGAL